MIYIDWLIIKGSTLIPRTKRTEGLCLRPLFYIARYLIEFVIITILERYF